MAADNWTWKDAVLYFRRALALLGGDATTRLWYGETLMKLGRFPEAIRELSVARRLNPLSAVIVNELGWAFYSAGRHEEAIATFRSALEITPSFAHANDGLGSTWDVALVAISLGRKEEALRWLEQAYETRDFPMAYLNIDPAFKELRSNPDFIRLLKKMGFEA